MLIDVTRLILRLLKEKKVTGVDRVSLAYIGHYRIHSTGTRAMLSWRGRVLVLSVELSQTVFRRLLDAADAAPDKWFWLKLLSRLAWTRSAWRTDTQFQSCFLFNTGHKGLESAGYAETLRRMGVRPLYFIHDLIPLTHPEYCRPQEDDKHRQRMVRALRDAAGLVANSEFTRQELLAFAQEGDYPCPPTVTAWLASGLGENVGQSSAPPFLSTPYFVMLGTIEPRKNHLLILQVWRQLAAKYGAQTPQLVLIGQRGWECEQVIDLLERCAAIKPFVVEIGGCSDAQLHHILSGARALLFPSFVEGFGMPLVEALSLRIPVLASDIAVFREIGQGIPEFIDPIDGMGWLKAIEQYTVDSAPLREAQMTRLAGYRHWDWAAHFAVVDGLMMQLDADGHGQD